MDTIRISDAKKHKIICLRQEGVSVTDISDELGISVSRLFSLLSASWH